MLLAGLCCFVLLPARPAAATAARAATNESPLAAMAAVPALMRTSPVLRLLMVCFLSSGYARSVPADGARSVISGRRGKRRQQGKR